SGFLTRGFALIAENPNVDVWVMDPAVQSDELTTNLPASALEQVRSVVGARWAMPLALGYAEGRFPNGRFQQFEVIGVDGSALGGVPPMSHGETAMVLREPDSVIVDPGGTEGKLETPLLAADRWTYESPHLNASTRPLSRGDELLVNDHRVWIAGRIEGLPRF